jgi:hypothetical protein
MAKSKFDGVVEAVHYQPDGQVGWVRAYLRRGKIFTDRTMLDRQTLVEQLKSGKRYLVGERVPLMGGTFDVSSPLRVLQINGREVIVSSDTSAEKDHLEGVPII